MNTDPMLNHLAGPMFALNTDRATDTAANARPDWAFWARGYGSASARSGNDVATRYDYDLGGISIGFDRKVNNWLLLGLSTGYSSGKVDMRHVSETGRIDSYQGSLYGFYKSEPWYADGILAYGYNRYDTSRDIFFGGIDTTTVTPEVRVRWFHEFSNDDYVLDAVFAGAPVSSFTIKGDKPNRDSVGFGLGVNAVTKNNVDLFLEYDGKLSGGYTEHAGSLGFRYRW